tara:strand:- start:235 stop:402 length:168 start_codon:yes stop_codon:yes gene_type:complete
MTTYTPEKINEMYRDWFDNFLTVARFAEYYEIREQTARYIIRAGRIAHNKMESTQ